MKRELKFRAKIKGDAGIYPAHTVDNLHLRVLVDRACGLEWVDMERVEIMQYTGLKDKEGTDIYEDDIVKAEHHNPAVFQIVFREGGFCAVFPGCTYPLDINHFYPSNGCCIKVIGNVFQNKRLLK